MLYILTGASWTLKCCRKTDRRRHVLRTVVLYTYVPLLCGETTQKIGYEPVAVVAAVVHNPSGLDPALAPATTTIINAVLSSNISSFIVTIVIIL